MLRLYEATLEVRWFDAARETAEAMIERFADDENGGFFTTSNDHEELIARRKDVGDHPIPSGNSSAAYGLLRLAALTGDTVGAVRAYRHYLALRTNPEPAMALEVGSVRAQLERLVPQAAVRTLE